MPQASDRELLWVLRIGVVVMGVLSTAIAVSVQSIYGLYVMCSDLMYVVLFPQFTCVLFVSGTNPYGGLVGFFISLPLRVLSGEPLLSLPALIRFPLYDEDAGQGFPFRSFAMLSGFLAIVVVSRLTSAAYHRGWVSPRWDVLGYFSRAGLPRLHGMEEAGGKGVEGADGKGVEGAGGKGVSGKGWQADDQTELRDKLQAELMEREEAEDGVAGVNDVGNERGEHRDPLLIDKPIIRDHSV